jgi:CRP/FNR family cyclic AMP-dependent transcriptional regulator
MDQMKIVELLRSVPLFSDLSDHDLRTVADRMKEVHFTQGTSVATQGQTGVGFHLVVDGTAEVVKDGARVTELRHGGYFGEIGLIDGGPRSATVTATSDLTTVSLVGWDFTPLLDNPSFTRGLLMGLCKIARQEKGG